MPTLEQINNININGNNYDRTRTLITLSVASLGIVADISTSVTSIDYQETPDIQFGYSLGSRRPTAVGFGNIESDGSITFTDGGLMDLNNRITKSLLPSILYLGQTGQMNITIEYATYSGKVKTDILEHVYFTNNNNGVNTGDVINEREISMIIGRINTGSVI